MNSSCEKVSRIPLLLIILAIVVIVLAGLLPASRVFGSPAAATPKVTSITQITHDGFHKVSLVAGDTHLYVNEMLASKRMIADITLPNGDRSEFPSSLSNAQVLDLSPDRSKLLVSSIPAGTRSSELWSLPIASGSPQRMGTLSGFFATWSKDGKHLVSSNGRTLFIADSNGMQERELYTANGFVIAPRFSPDGQRIRFTLSDMEHESISIWEINQDGSNPHVMFGDWPYKSKACYGKWTDDGRYYIFQVIQNVPNTKSRFSSLWALPEAASAGDSSKIAPIALTSGPMSYGPTFLSPDNKKIWALGVQPGGQVLKYDPAKSQFLPVLSGVSATDVAYSPDGQWLAYVAIPENTLWRSRADGSEKLQLTLTPGRAALPQWSPDGKQIAYVSLQPGESWKIFLVPAAGGAAQELLPENSSQMDPSWSPDGTRIMFGSSAGDAAAQSIRVLDLKTHKVETIPGSEGTFSPRWSPNGRYIAALSAYTTTVMMYDFETQKWSKWLTQPAGAVNFPQWSADSQYLYFDDLVEGDESIRRVKVGENHAEQVLTVDVVNRFAGALGPWIGRAADGSWMFVQDRSTQEVYQLDVELP